MALSALKPKLKLCPPLEDLRGFRPEFGCVPRCCRYHPQTDVSVLWTIADEVHKLQREARHQKPVVRFHSWRIELINARVQALVTPSTARVLRPRRCRHRSRIGVRVRRIGHACHTDEEILSTVKVKLVSLQRGMALTIHLWIPTMVRGQMSIESTISVPHRTDPAQLLFPRRTEDSKEVSWNPLVTPHNEDWRPLRHLAVIICDAVIKGERPAAVRAPSSTRSAHPLRFDLTPFLIGVPHFLALTVQCPDFRVVHRRKFEELVNTWRPIVPVDHGSSFHLRDTLPHALPVQGNVSFSTTEVALVHSEPPP